MAPRQSPAEVQAQQEYFQRANGPVIGGRASLSSDPKRLLKQYQQLGRIPAHFESWEQINREFSALIKQGLSENEARTKLHLTYRTPTGEHIITEYDRYGKDNYINARNINEDLHPEAEAHLLRERGPQYVEEVRNKGMHDWGSKKSKTPDVMAPTAQQDAVAARDRMTANIGRTNPRDSAAQLHRGHGFSASQSSAGPHRSNLQPEWGPFNTQGHAGVPGNPRYHPDTMADLNFPPTMEAGVYYDQLDKEGLNLLPYDAREAGDFMAADEWQVVKGKGPGVQGNYDITSAPEPARYPAESILPRAEERLRNGMTPAGRRAAADAQSTLMDTTDATALSGPVRSTQVITPEVAKKLEDYLTPEQARRVIAQRTQEAARPNRSSTTSKPKPTAPKPTSKPTPQPTSTRVPVGTQRNGKTWNGKRWVPTMRNRLTSKRGTGGQGGTQTVQVEVPSQQRFGPFGMFSTIDMPHERQFQWRR